MNDSAAFSLVIFLRLLAVWWVVRFWANRSYRSREIVSDAGTTDLATRGDSRRKQRLRSMLLLLTWIVGALAIWLAGLTQTRLFQSSNQISQWFAFGVGVAFVGTIFFAAEWAATGRSRLLLNIAGWLCAVLLSFAYCAAGSHPSHLLDRLAAVTIMDSRMWFLAVGYFIVLIPVGDWIERLMSRWTEHLPPEQGLPAAGTWIGRLERFLIVTCLLAGQPAGIAILVTAKGALRFGEIRQDADPGNQRKLVEYILIGSMLSYSFALPIGWLMTMMIR